MRDLIIKATGSIIADVVLTALRTLTVLLILHWLDVI